MSGFGLDSLMPVVGATGRLDLERLDADVAGGLVGEEGHQLLGEAPERRAVGPLVAQVGQLVRDERVVGDVDVAWVET